MSLGLLGVGALALALAALNGLHDASNAVSTTIATRTLSERAALRLAAGLNLLGALLGLGVAESGTRLALDGLRPALEPAGSGSTAVVLIAAALLGGLAWGLFTWWRGTPSSTWHAVYGGLAGATLALGLRVPWTHEIGLVALSLLISPLLGGGLTYLLVLGLARVTTRTRVRNRHLRAAQTVSAGAVAAGHGMTDVLLPMSALVLAAEATDSAPLPWWAGPLLAVALALGTLAGGRRIIRTLVSRLTDLSTAQGLAAETSAAVMMLAASIGLGAPVSTSHTITAGIVGSGLAVGPRSVRWPVVGRILATWVATPVVAGGAAALAATVLSVLPA